jgi:hypothetical protein
MIKTSQQIVDDIVLAKDKPEAKKILHDIFEALHLTNDYTALIKLKQQLDVLKEDYVKTSDSLRELATPRTYVDIHEIRVELNFLYRDIADNLSFEINRLKIYYEEAKTIKRGEAIMSLSNNEDVKSKFNTKSTSSLRDIVGLEQSYKEYAKLSSISYGLYQDLQNTLNSIRQMIDSIASEEKVAFEIEKRDVK